MKVVEVGRFYKAACMCRRLSPLSGQDQSKNKSRCTSFTHERHGMSASIIFQVNETCLHVGAVQRVQQVVQQRLLRPPRKPVKLVQHKHDRLVAPARLGRMQRIACGSVGSFAEPGPHHELHIADMCVL